MSYAADELPYMEVVGFANEAPSLGKSGVSPLDSVSVQGYIEAGGGLGFQQRSGNFDIGFPAQLLPTSCVLSKQMKSYGSCEPLSWIGKSSDRYTTDMEKRRTALHSVESTLSTVEFPHTPSKLFTEPARVEDPSPFNLQTLDFLNSSVSSIPEQTRSVRLKLATAPAEMVTNEGVGRELAQTNLEMRGPSRSGNLPNMMVGASSRLADVSSTSGGSGPGPQRLMSNKSDVSGMQESPSLPDGELPSGLSDARGTGDSLPSVCNSSGQGNEDWVANEVKRAFDKPGMANPRKTEQNRRAQARFRQRKKDMFVEQQRQIQNLTIKLEEAMREKKTFQEKTSVLQQMVAANEKRIEALKSQGKDGTGLQEMVDACWEFVKELKRGRQGMEHNRDTVADMVNAMLSRNSPALGFLRRELVEQLRECLKQDGECIDTPANLWMNDLINAYERMVHKCGECHPQAFRALLALQLPEQQGQTANNSFWGKVLAAGSFRADQRCQLASARNGLMSKIQQLVNRRQDIARLVQSIGPESGLHEQPLLGNMAQAQHVLDLHAHILKEEQTAVFNFLAIVRLVLEPVQQAKLMVAAFPFAPDTLAICSMLGDESSCQETLNGSAALLSQLPCDSPFRALAANQLQQLSPA